MSDRPECGGYLGWNVVPRLRTVAAHVIGGHPIDGQTQKRWLCVAGGMAAAGDTPLEAQELWERHFFGRRIRP